MEFKVQEGEVAKWQGDAVIIGLPDGPMEQSTEATKIDRALDGALSKIIQESEFKPLVGRTRVIYTLGKLPAARICVVGLGKTDEVELDVVRKAAAESVKAVSRSGAKNVAMTILGAGINRIDVRSAAQAVAEGIALGLWRFQKYFAPNSIDELEENPRTGIESVTLLATSQADIPAIQEALERGRIIAEGTNLARNLANEPGNTLTPTRMAQIAKEVAEKNALEFFLIDREEAARKGMGAFIGVAQGSEEPPAIIVMRYWGADKNQPGGLGLIGKGITFDSGGISLKPGNDMEHMKGDMSGGAAVIGAMQAIAQLKPKVNVTGIVMATENMPSGKAYKPGDILRAMNGKTIEVVNTDAEGRLVLADAVAYATKELKLDTVVDAATLTGSVIIALGHHRTGLFTNDQGLAEEISQAGERTGERMWQLPMDKEYREQLKSDWADIKNTGGRPAGAITGAWFIRSFVENGARWAHLDIAGSAQMGDGKERGYINKWGTGVPTRTFIELALARAKKSG